MSIQKNYPLTGAVWLFMIKENDFTFVCIEFAVLDGAVAAPCYPKSAIGGLNPLLRADFVGSASSK